MNNVKGRKVESCSRIKDGNGKLAQGEDEVRRVWKEYFEDLYNIDTREQVAIHICGFDGIRIGYYFRGERFERPEFEVRVGKLKNEKAAGCDKITGEMIKGGGYRVVDCIYRGCAIWLLRVVLSLKTGDLL